MPNPRWDGVTGPVRGRYGYESQTMWLDPAKVHGSTPPQEL
jgi:hypothetical protein